MPLSSLFAAAMRSIGGFESSPTLAIAVSGGADSMALLLLANAWAKERGGDATALTVDHGLRTESAEEARQVAAWCKTHHIEHHILKKSNIKANQEAAREARYQLLAEWCKRHDVSCLLTAHHRGDQAETLFFRLARGSGILGLACIAPHSQMNGVRLVRPLLSFSKHSLEEFLQQERQPWIEDPTNQSDKYTRNVIRRHLQALPNADDIEARAAVLAERFGRIRIVIENMLAEATEKTVEPIDNGAELHAQIFVTLPPEIARLMLSRLAQRLSGTLYPPRSEKIDRLYDALMSKRRVTLSGLLFSYHPRKGRYCVQPERAPLNP